MYNNIALLIGHIVGDYLFQNDFMAKNKGLPGIRGHLICILHCSIYATIVAAAVLLGGWRHISRFDDDGPHGLVTSYCMAWVVAWLTHFPIDRFGLSKKWMEFFGQTLEGPFMPCVYIGVDNGAHLLLMWVLFSVLGA